MNNKILLLWGFIITALLGTILVIGNNMKDKDFEMLKDQLENITEKYLKDTESLPKNNEILKIPVEDLLEKEYIDSLEEIEKYCIKEIHVKKELLLYKYSYNIKCEEE